MLHTIRKIEEVQEGHRIVCRFDEDEKRLVDLKPLLRRLDQTPVIQRLWDGNYFREVFLDDYGTLAWDNGVDFCPDVLYAHSLPFPPKNQQKKTV
ncbi:DUF2442 domain-containing protein [Larkinella soli]|uniref:DUF2442 domain-containing protein n=1 Tax=Larkinella soli TaxID=1770527 RepID=UPI000FFB5E84|nr:DUF2442 domain-containing protein [Larkinella soli]